MAVKLAAMKQLVGLRFALARDAEGWPPVASETVWAEPIGGDRYRIANAPFFVRELAPGDVVTGVRAPDGVLWSGAFVSASGRLVVRVVPLREGPLGGAQEPVFEAFAPLGLRGESGLPQFNVIAFDVPPDADLAAVKALLAAGEADGRWDYEEACVTRRWSAL